MKKDTFSRRSVPKRTYVKFVKRAGMFCRTSVKDGKQHQEWFSKNPDV